MSDSISGPGVDILPAKERRTGPCKGQRAWWKGRQELKEELRGLPGKARGHMVWSTWVRQEDRTHAQGWISGP